MGPTPLVIVGAGGFGREVLDVVEAINVEGSPHSSRPLFDFLGFLDDGEIDTGLIARRGASLLGPLSFAVHLPAETLFTLAIGWPESRRRAEDRLSGAALTYAVLVHPQAAVGSRCQLGPGAIVCANATLTTEVRLGRHSHVHVNAAVGHDTTLGDRVTVLPGATVGGGVSVSDDVMIGANSAVLQGLRIGPGSGIGAGAAVIQDVPPRVTVVGVPAKVR